MNHLSYSNKEEVSVSFFLIGKLRDLLADEKIYLQAVTDVVDKLAEMLARMDDLIEHPHVRRDKRIKDIINMVDLTIDSIEMYVFRVVKNHTFRAFLLRSKLCLAIENLTTKIRDFVDSQSGEGSSGASLEPRRPYKVQDLSYFLEKDFIGRKNDINNLVSYLVDHEEEEYQVISIHGMGGLGKTTLARKVYKDKKVLGHFQRFAFVCVSQNCQAKEILKHILQQLLFKEEKDMKNMTGADVTESLKSVLGENRCLVVVDDVWSVDDWGRLSCDLLGGRTSKVLLTTRTKDVAEKGFYYPLKCLSEDESWELCRKTLSRFQDGEEKRMEELGREMISWCSGNPLAVIVLRGVLVTKGRLQEWQKFYETRKSEGDRVYNQFKDGVGRQLLYSYEELPYPLKPCFLYMASFSEDEEIDVEILYRLWDGEGMILSKDKKEGETMMDVGERYLEELVGRCMIEGELDDKVNPNVGRRYKFCRVHEGKENFLKVHDYRGPNDITLKLPTPYSVNDTLVPSRQFLYFSDQYHKLIIEDYKQKGTRYLRSLMFSRGKVKKLSALKKMTLMRVLSFDNMLIQSKEVTHELIHLRYLSFNRCVVKSFQPFNFNYMYLQTLDMRAWFLYLDHNSTKDHTIPNDSLKRLKRLKHLYLPLEFYQEVTPKYSRLRLDGLTKLETLVNVKSSKCEMNDITQLTRLRRLEMRFCISSEDDGEEMKELVNKINLDQLSHLLLAVELENPNVEIYLDVLKGQLPEFLVKLLQELEEMTCSATGFPKLTHLTFSYMENWEKWSIEERAMPNLRFLMISNCPKFEELPDGLAFITSLERLDIECMSEEFKRRLRGDGSVGGEGPDFYKIRHVPIVEF